jgi:putative membrane protein|tara:strand:- start:1455 stop:2378 length:924 start_codon:yes stop_codon:yes gene_type:complete
MLTSNTLLFLKGLAMGAADVVPGVSGGTVAFITGIYFELVSTIKSFDIVALRLLKSEGLGAAWRHVNGNFIAVLLTGILTSVFSLAQLMHYLLAEHGVPLWSFFSGLIIGSVILLLRQNPPTIIPEKLLFLLGILIAYGISISPSVVLEGGVITMFFAGAIALCAMILPGISGSFILVLLGLYPVFISAIADLQVDILVAFAMGGIFGLMLFSRFLSWLLSRFQTAVITVMCGFLVGSLSIIWPWKNTLFVGITNADEVSGTVTENVFPSQFLEVTGQDPQTLLCLFVFFIGFVMVLSVEFLTKAKS